MSRSSRSSLYANIRFSYNRFITGFRSRLAKNSYFYNRGRTEAMFWSGDGQLPIKNIDTYIVGFVRQLNRLGYNTMFSCDGHDQRAPHVVLPKDVNIDELIDLLKAAGIQNVSYQENRSNYAL